MVSMDRLSTPSDRRLDPGPGHQTLDRGSDVGSVLEDADAEHEVRERPANEITGENRDKSRWSNSTVSAYWRRSQADAPTLARL